jgi:hypothetical protein
MKWITRARPQIDPGTRPWRVARRIDPEAECLDVPDAQAGAG